MPVNIATMVDSTEYKDRLLKAMEMAEVERQALANHLGVSYQAVRKVVEGMTKAFTAANNEKAASFLGVESKWLATGEGPMTRKSSQTNTDKSGLTPIDPSRFRPVWVVGRGSGGKMPERVWTDGDYPVGVTEEYAELATSDPHAFLGEVVGPSMIPRYNPGEFFLVEPGTEPEVEDDVLVRLKDGQTLLKRLLSRRGGYRLGSYNSEETLFYKVEEVSWIYYVAHPVPRRRIKNRA